MEEITCLDGVTWQKNELLKRLEEDEFYYGYGGKYMLSKSSLSDLLKSPKSYVYKRNSNQSALLLGRMFHQAILEPEKYEDLYLFPPAVDKRTKLYKELVKTHPYKTIVKPDHKDKIDKWTMAYTRNKTAVDRLRGAKVEVAECGYIEGLPFRAKADVITRNGTLIDLKTCQNLKGFKRDAYGYNYDLQVYVYCQMFNKTYKQFEFIAIDKVSLDIGFYKCSKEFYESGKAKFDYVIDFYKKYIHGKDKDEVTEFIYDYYYEDEL